MGEREFRSRIYWLTFAFSVLVIWVHAVNAELFLGPGAGEGWVGRTEQFLGSGLGQFAVPGFFVLSAYLFFRGFSMAQLKRKWKSRVRSLLIPYLLWNGLYYAGYAAATRIPLAASVVGKPPVPVNLPEFLDALFFYAYNPVFWYLFQLILLTALAPALYFVMKDARSGGTGLVLLGFFLSTNRNFPVLNGDALFYYGMGAFASLHGRKWIEEAGRPGRGCAKIICLAALAGLSWLLGRPGFPLYRSALSLILFRAFGAGTAAMAALLLPLPPAAEFMKNNFFLYAMHFAWVRLINKSAALVLPHEPFFALGTFIAMPAAITALCTLFAGLGRRFCPQVYSLFSGSR